MMCTCPRLLQSLGGEPQHVIQNCTAFGLKYRQNAPKAAWMTLHPYTAEGFVRPYLLEGSNEVELRDENTGAKGGYSYEVRQTLLHLVSASFEGVYDPRAGYHQNLCPEISITWQVSAPSNLFPCLHLLWV